MMTTARSGYPGNRICDGELSKAEDQNGVGDRHYLCTIATAETSQLCHTHTILAFYLTEYSVPRR